MARRHSARRSAQLPEGLPALRILTLYGLAVVLSVATIVDAIVNALLGGL